METVQSDNADVKIERLFTHDGVTVYRFFDGRFVYFTVPATLVQSEIQCGKTTCPQFNIPANKVPK